MAAMPIGVVIVKFLDRWRIVFTFTFMTLEALHSRLYTVL